MIRRTRRKRKEISKEKLKVSTCQLLKASVKTTKQPNYRIFKLMWDRYLADHVSMNSVYAVEPRDGKVLEFSLDFSFTCHWKNEFEFSKCVAVVLAWITICFETCVNDKSFVWAHIPNESNNSSKFQKSVMQMGRIPGAPDYFVKVGRKVIFLELKYGHNKLSKEQMDFRAWVGVDTFHVVRDMDGLLHHIRKLIPQEYDYIIPEVTVRY